MIRLAKLTKYPKQKIHWALRVLENRGHLLGNLISDAPQPQKYEIDGNLLTIQDVYKIVSKYPEWNDRLGIGTATLLPVSSKRL